MDLLDQEVIDSGCSRHMTGNMSYLIDYEEIDRGYVAFGGNPKGGKIIGKGSAMPSDPHHIPTIIKSSSQPQKTQKPRNPKRNDTQVPQPSGPTDIVADETIYKELGDSLVRAATTASSLEVEQDSGNITKTRSKATPNEAGSQGTTSGGGPRVLDLEKTKTTQQNEIASLKRRVKKLEQKKRRINAIDADKDITLVNVQDDAEMFNVNTLTGDEVFTEQEVTAKDVNLTIDEVTLAQELAALKSVKPKGKGIMVEEPVKTMKKKDLIRLDEEIASKLQAEFDEEERLAREKAEKEQEANVALIEEWDDIQAMIEADHELAQRLQADKQEELFVEEKAKLFQQLLEQRRKHFAAKSAEEKRNKPPTQAQQRKIMCTYLKNMEGKKPKDLKNKSFDSIQKMFDRAFKRVNTFVDFRTDLVEGSSKRAGEELEQESTKKQKVDEDKDTTELQSLMEVIPDEEEVAIDVVPLATKPPTIVEWKIHKEGKKSYYQIVRADGKSQMYRVFILMLKSFSREDLKDLYKLVKAKYKSTRLVEDLDLVLWSDLKTMFEPHVEDEIWKLQQRYVEQEASEELFTHKEEMDLETAQTNTAVKLPLLKQENGNSFKPAATTIINVDGTSTTLIPGPVTADEKTQKKNDVKARRGTFEQIHEDDLEKMDLKWQLALLSMRIRSWDTLQGNVEDLGTKIAGTRIKTALEGLYMADDEVPTNMALMDFLDSEFNKSEFNLATYKRGLASVEEQLVFYKKNENSPVVLLVEELVLKDKLEKKTVFPAKIEFVRPKQQEKPADCNHHQRERVVSGNNYTRVNYNYSAKKAHPSAYRNMVPRAVLMKTGLRSLNTTRPINNAHPKTTVYSARPMPKAVNTARPNSVVVNAVRENQGHPQKENQGYVDSGCSRHMTGNMSYLSDFKEFDGGYVTFGGGAKGGKITSKGTLKTGKLDFKDVYFIKEL
ncbi:hypothetical protein Tco_1391197 [Tanacetum coccineum]